MYYRGSVVCRLDRPVTSSRWALVGLHYCEAALTVLYWYCSLRYLVFVWFYSYFITILEYINVDINTKGWNRNVSGLCSDALSLSLNVILCEWNSSARQNVIKSLGVLSRVCTVGVAWCVGWTAQSLSSRWALVGLHYCEAALTVLYWYCSLRYLVFVWFYSYFITILEYINVDINTKGWNRNVSGLCSDALSLSLNVILCEWNSIARQIVIKSGAMPTVSKSLFTDSKLAHMDLKWRKI